MMKFSAAFILIISVIILSAGCSCAAPSDAGHVYFVEPVNPVEPQNVPQANTRTLTPNMSVLREVVITENMSRQIATLFPGTDWQDVHSLVGNENTTIDSEARAITSELASHLEQTGEEIMLSFPSVTAQEAGVYVLGVAMQDIAEPGTLIDSVSTITPASSAANFRSAADIEQITILDQGGNLIPPKRATNGLTYITVPENQNMLVAMQLNSGDTWTGSLTKPVQLPTILVEPVTISQVAEIVHETDEQAQTETIEETTERITNNIIEAVQNIIARPEVIELITTNDVISRDILSRDVTSIDIKTFTSADIVSDPEEPTPAMVEAVTNDGYEIAAKLNTIQVAEGGFYLFKVTLSEESFQKLRGMTAHDVRAYALSDSEVEIMPSFITGIINTFELLTMSGEKMDTIGMREFLLVGLLNAGKPFSVYLAKILLALLLGGCNYGWSIAAICAVPVVIALTKRYRR